MKNTILSSTKNRYFSFVLFISFLLSYTFSYAQHQENAKNRLIIKVKTAHAIKKIENTLSKDGRQFQLKRLLPSLGLDHPANKTFVLEGLHDIDLEIFGEKYGLGTDLEYIEKDWIGKGTGSVMAALPPSDPLFIKQWYLHNTGEINLYDIRAKEGSDIDILNAWSVSQRRAGVTVAILDTGLDFSLDEFIGRLWINQAEIPNNNLDDDKNGYVDDMHGYDFVNEKSYPSDDAGHGTGIAGVIAANYNNLNGVAGIDQNCHLMICKVLKSDQTGFYSDWASGIYYAVDNGADIINLSVAGEADLKVLSEAIAYAKSKDVLVVCSMGNNNNAIPSYPAAYGSTVAVGATDPDDHRSLAFNGSSEYGSNFGEHIDISAPGNIIYGLGLSNSTAIHGGTSMSSAVVSGVAALILSNYPQLSAEQILSALHKTAEDEVGNLQEDLPGWDIYHGFGRVNAYRALNYLSENPTLENPFSLKIYPNPTNEAANITLLLSSLEPVKLKLLSSDGKLVEAQTIVPNSRDFQIEMTLHSLSSGLYFLILESGGKRHIKRFIKL